MKPRPIAFVLYVLTVIVLALTVSRGRVAICVAVGGLIAPASRAAVPKRPIPLYIGFGLLMGYCFWLGVYAMRFRDGIVLILVLLVAVGAVWTLRKADWPSLIFATVAILISLALGMSLHNAKPDYEDEVPDRDNQTGFAMITVLSLGLCHTALGVAEKMEWREQSRQAKRSASKSKSKPQNPPPSSEDGVE
jgi:hypothetical protein